MILGRNRGPVKLSGLKGSKIGTTDESDDANLREEEIISLHSYFASLSKQSSPSGRAERTWQTRTTSVRLDRGRGGT